MKKTIARMTLLFAVLMAVIIPKSYVLAEEPAAEMESEEVFSQWNPEAPALNALIDYVEAVTDEASPDYIPEEDRIAVFDMDGTLMGELYPTYLE